MIAVRTYLESVTSEERDHQFSSTTEHFGREMPIQINPPQKPGSDTLTVESSAIVLERYFSTESVTQIRRNCDLPKDC